MSGRRKNGAALRVQGVAALLCGERPAVVARELGVPEGTVRSWKHRTKNRGIATLKKGDFGALLSEHLEALIRSLLAQSRELSGRWSEMGAGDLALAFGLLFDRTMRMLELAPAFAGNPRDHEASTESGGTGPKAPAKERHPQRKGRE